RFVWPDALHAAFVTAIFDVGLKLASPRVLLDMMPDPQGLTTEHVKSHLQKFRLHRDKSREEFLTKHADGLSKGFD
ncbi:hypothetical protein JKP88DRAFT_145800, partial [Tribonema minus]